MEDFRIESDRWGSNFYYPAATGAAILNRIGYDADEFLVSYENRDMSLTEAQRAFANSLLRMLRGGASARFEPFTFCG